MSARGPAQADRAGRRTSAARRAQPPAHRRRAVRPRRRRRAPADGAAGGGARRGRHAYRVPALLGDGDALCRDERPPRRRGASRADGGAPGRAAVRARRGSGAAARPALRARRALQACGEPAALAIAVSGGPPPRHAARPAGRSTDAGCPSCATRRRPPWRRSTWSRRSKPGSACATTRVWASRRRWRWWSRPSSGRCEPARRARGTRAEARRGHPLPARGRAR